LKNTSFIKNVSFNSLGFIFQVILVVIATPIILNSLGKEIFGVWILINSIIGYFSFTQGISNSTIKYISEYYTKKDFKKINSIYTFSILVFGFSALFLSFSLYLCSDIIISSNLFMVSNGYQNIAIKSFQLASIILFLSIVHSIFDSILKGIQRFDLFNIISIVMIFKTYIGYIVLVKLGFSIIEMLYLTLFIKIVRLFISYFFCKKYISSLKINFNYSRSFFKEFKIFSYYSIGSSFFGQLTNHLDKFMISSFIGFSSLSFYAIPNRLLVRIKGFVNKIYEVCFPKFSEMVVNSNESELISFYKQISKITLVISITIFLPVVLYSFQIINIWIGYDYALKGYEVMILLSIGSFLNITSGLSTQVNLGLGFPKVNTFFSFITSFLNIILIIPFIFYWGIKGAALSFFVSSLSSPISLLYCNKYILKIKNYIFLKDVYFIPIFSLVLVAILSDLFLIGLINNFLSLFFVSILTCIFYLLLLMLFKFINKEDFKIFTDLLNR